MPYLSPYHWPVSNSTNFCENVEIPRKRANSTALLKIPRSAENCAGSDEILLMMMMMMMMMMI